MVASVEKSGAAGPSTNAVLKSAAAKILPLQTVIRLGEDIALHTSMSGIDGRVCDCAAVRFQACVTGSCGKAFPIMANPAGR
jgi:hypothetical protein